MKSQVENPDGFLLTLLFKVLDDTCYHVGRSSLSRDKAYAKSRVECEGLSFLTETLPRFLKAVMEGVESGTYVPPSGFKLLKRSLLPAFLSGWTMRIFHLDGKLRSDSDPYAFGEVYQICSLLYKLELPYSKSKEAAVVNQFIRDEEDLSRFSLSTDHDDVRERALARRLLSRVFEGFDPTDIYPKHGPGSVASGERGNGKWVFRTKYPHLHAVFPYYRYFSPSLSRLSFESGWYTKLQSKLTATAKVVLVPKDSRGPRLISMEPLEIQFIQQGVMQKVVDRVHDHTLTRGRVSFENQDINRTRALLGSRYGHLATVDLKNASDRISLALFRDLFPKDVVRAFEACRSTETRLRGGKTITMHKFAPMGSALCFPVLALTVWALSESAIFLRNRQRRNVSVFGDDLIVPASDFDAVCASLTRNGLLVNTSKSYHKGPFRESCGMDAYKGVPVTPIRVKRALHGVHPDASVLAHLTELSDAFFDKGYWSTCAFLREHVERVFGPTPWTVDRNFPGFYCPDPHLCEVRNWSLGIRSSWNEDLQRTEFGALTAVQAKQSSYAGSHIRLQKGLRALYADSAEDHQVTVRNVSTLRRSWVAV